MIGGANVDNPRGFAIVIVDKLEMRKQAWRSKRTERREMGWPLVWEAKGEVVGIMDGDDESIPPHRLQPHRAPILHDGV